MKNGYWGLTLRFMVQIGLALFLALLVEGGLVYLAVMYDAGGLQYLYDAIDSQYLHVTIGSQPLIYLKKFCRMLVSDMNNIILMYLVLAVFFVCLVVRKFSRYMQRIEAAIASVFTEQEAMVSLPGGLKPMEVTLNQIKYMLQQRAFATKEAEQQKNDLVVYLAHDLKTPLTAILGYSSLLQDGPLPVEAEHRYVGIINDKAQRMAFLLDELFDIARFNVREITLVKQEVDLVVMLEQVVEEFYPLLQEKTLSVTLEKSATEKYLLRVDGDQLARVFDNLLRNAVSYGQRGSQIIITLCAEEEEMRIGVSSYGVSMPQDKLVQIFDKFYRADESRSSDSGGSGIGLAVAKKIVELHGGVISAENANLWTTFTVLLPKETGLGKSVIKS